MPLVAVSHEANVMRPEDWAQAIAAFNRKIVEHVGRMPYEIMDELGLRRIPTEQ